MGKATQNEIVTLLNDLMWEYDRISSEGQDTFDKIENFVNNTKTKISPSNKILKELLISLVNDEQRMGSDGVETYDQLCQIFDIQ